MTSCWHRWIAYIACLGLVCLAGTAWGQDIPLRSGEVVTGARSVRVFPDHLLVELPTGVRRIELADLPDDWQQRYQYDPARAAAYRRKVRLANAQREWWQTHRVVDADEIAWYISRDTLEFRGRAIRRLSNREWVLHGAEADDRSDDGKRFVAILDVPDLQVGQDLSLALYPCGLAAWTWDSGETVMLPRYTTDRAAATTYVSQNLMRFDERDGPVYAWKDHLPWRFRQTLPRELDAQTPQRSPGFLLAAGFIVTRDLLAWDTSGSAATDEQRVWVSQGSVSAPCRVLRRLPEQGVMLVQLPDQLAEKRGLLLADDTPDLGDRVWVALSPQRAVPTMVSAVYPLDGGLLTFELDRALQPGIGPVPVVDSRGYLAGIVGYHDADDAERRHGSPMAISAAALASYIPGALENPRLDGDTLPTLSVQLVDATVQVYLEDPAHAD